MQAAAQSMQAAGGSQEGSTFAGMPHLWEPTFERHIDSVFPAERPTRPVAFHTRAAHSPELLPPPDAEPTPHLEGLPVMEPFACSDCGSGCGSGQCAPCTAKTRIGRFGWLVYHDICCPDPCYEPHWHPLVNAAFFTSGVRPQTRQRFRWDAGFDMILPDRAEYFWARADGNGQGPSPAGGERSLDYHDLWHYVETSHGSFSAFVEYSYRSTFPDIAPHEAGFGDINVGTKTLLLDTKLLQVAFQFRTFIPVGVASKGLGTGHVSLEPALILGLNLAPRTFLQAEVAEWIPISGDDEYAGAVLRFGTSLNHTLLQLYPDVPLVGTLELNGWSFQDGAFTDPVLGTLRPASNDTYLNGGIGLRLFICDKADIGVAYANAITSEHFAEQLIRSEFRYRY